MKNLILLTIIALISAGCPLKTREDLSEADAEIASQEQQVNIAKAEETASMGELQSSLRRLNGRIEALEYQLRQSKKEGANKSSADSETVNRLVEQMKLFDSSIRQMEQRLATLEARKAGAPKTNAEDPSQSYFAKAEALFKKKDWKGAIVAYQKYRDKFPSGRFWGNATYKIGVCFQELRLKNEAASFFEEVIEKKPKSSAARKARYRLSKLK